MTKAHPLASLASPPAGYQELWLSSEGLRLRAWLSAAAGERPAVVVVHGLGTRSKAISSTHGRCASVATACSSSIYAATGGSEGSYTTLGGRKRADVAAAMDELRRRGLATQGIVL